VEEIKKAYHTFKFLRRRRKDPKWRDEYLKELIEITANESIGENGKIYETLETIEQEEKFKKEELEKEKKFHKLYPKFKEGNITYKFKKQDIVRELWLFILKSQVSSNFKQKLKIVLLKNF
jgi:Zn-dependent oligopeptidase